MSYAYDIELNMYTSQCDAILDTPSWVQVLLAEK